MADDLLFSLSPKSNPKFVYSLLCSVADSSSSSFNFASCSSPRESLSVFVDYLRSHFSVSQPKATFPSSAEPRVLRFLSCCFAPPSYMLNFLRLPQTSHRSLPPTLTKLPITLKHLPHSGTNFPLHIFNPAFFLPSERHVLLFLSITWESFSTLLLSSILSLSPPASQSFLNALFYHVYSFFWSLIPFSFPARPVSAMDGQLWIKFCSLLGPFQMGLTNPGQALG